MRILERERPKQERVDHAEDGAIGGNPQRQRQHRNRCESRILEQHVHAITNILPERFHTLSSAKPAKLQNRRGRVVLLPISDWRLSTVSFRWLSFRIRIWQ